MSDTHAASSPTARPSRRRLANAIRALSMDAVQKAGSGHPGMPMGMADIAEVLWNDFLRHNPGNPLWPNRDRFVLSNGHGSMLLYSLLHLTGYPLPMEQLRQFRQLGSVTPGHPERNPEVGIETTTGPLGQGLANSVGMALAERILAAQFNRPGFDIVDHYTYAFCGDGCLMEGISHEACSLAGVLGLGKLVCFYDDNHISIDGDVSGWYRDDTPARFEAYGWHVVPAVDGHDPAAVRQAIEAARAASDRPSLICCRTVIGWGAPHKQGTASAHGSALGEEEVAAARVQLGWEYPPFEIPDDIRCAWDATDRGAAAERAWRKLLEDYRREHPEPAAQFERRMAAALPEHWSEGADEAVRRIAEEGKAMATRKASQWALDHLAPLLPELMGGSADLTGSNNTFHAGSRTLSAENMDGNYLHFGVREFAMCAVLSGIALHGGFIPYGGTFLVFSDYARNAVRLAALMGLREVFVFTHDSIGLGEDGPTHQPVEQLASLRAMPNMRVWRPCDDVETVVAWRDAVEHTDGPTSLVLTRQSVAHQPRSGRQLEDIRRGGYVIRDGGGAPELIIIATGSEVALAVDAAARLETAGRAVRVVSMPCVEAFESQPVSYRESVLPEAVSARLAVEAGSPQGWWRYVGTRGAVLAMTSFGESAPGEALFRHFGFTVDNVVERAQRLLSER